MAHRRFKSDSVHNHLIRAQETMLAGINARSRGTVFNYFHDTELPIHTGTERWRSFRATLVSYMVEEEEYWENVRLVGSAVTNRSARAFTAPGSDRPDVEDKPEHLGLELMHLPDLDILPYAAEIRMRAYDDSSDFTKVLLNEFKRSATSGLAGATASIPYGGSLQSVGNAAIDLITRKIGGPDEVGYNQAALSEIPQQIWKRSPEMHHWIGHKFLYFYNYDSADKEWEEGYLALFRFELLSQAAITGEVPTTTSTRERKPDNPEVRNADDG